LDVAAARETGIIQSYLQPIDRKIPMIATDDVGRTAAELMQEEWSGVRVVELEAMERVSPSAIAQAFAKTLGHDVTVRAVPRTAWEEIFRAQGMKNPLPRMQMVDGFNEGWIDFSDKGSGARKGRIGIEAAIAALTSKQR
jgi:NAD(P)H dehydrogenase (quinone)